MGDIESKHRIGQIGLTRLYINTQRVMNKQNELDVLVHEGRYDIVAFTKT